MKILEEEHPEILGSEECYRSGADVRAHFKSGHEHYE